MMTPKSQLIGTIVISIIGVLTIIGSALWLKGTEYENTWLYLSSFWIIVFAAFEVFSKKK